MLQFKPTSFPAGPLNEFVFIQSSEAGLSQWPLVHGYNDFGKSEFTKVVAASTISN
jgi:hypothetical protein